MKPICSLRQRAIARSFNARRSSPSTRDFAVGGPVHRGDQMQQSGFARTQGPISATNSPLLISRSTSSQRDHLKLVALVNPSSAPASR